MVKKSHNFKLHNQNQEEEQTYLTMSPVKAVKRGNNYRAGKCGKRNYLNTKINQRWQK